MACRCGRATSTGPTTSAAGSRRCAASDSSVAGLRRIALHPLVGRDRVPPEVLLRDGSRLRGEVFLGDREHLVDWRHAIAVRPVAAEEDAILAEDFGQRVEARAIGAEIG